MNPEIKEYAWKAVIIGVIWIVLTIIVFSGGKAHAETTAQKVAAPETWLSHTALKWGFVGAFAGSQAMSGIAEGYSFGGRDIAGEDAYHVFRTGRDLGWLATGYLGYATIRNTHQTGWGKARRILGASLIGRDAFEWSYRAQRYGNPFDYTKDHNRHSLVYFGFRNGKITDLYVGTGPATGPLVDMAFLATGLLLLGWE